MPKPLFELQQDPRYFGIICTEGPKDITDQETVEELIKDAKSVAAKQNKKVTYADYIDGDHKGYAILLSERPEHKRNGSMIPIDCPCGYPLGKFRSFDDHSGVNMECPDCGRELLISNQLIMLAKQYPERYELPLTAPIEMEAT